MIATLWLGCVGWPVAPPPPSVEVYHQFAIEARGRAFAGMAVVRIDGPAYSLVAITPGGVELFSVSGDGDQDSVSAPQEDLEAILGRLPFDRDLHLLYSWSCGPTARCRVGGGWIEEGPSPEGWLRSWTGPGGPALVTIEDGRATLEDPRRGYRLKVVGEEIRVPVR